MVITADKDRWIGAVENINLPRPVKINKPKLDDNNAKWKLEGENVIDSRSL